MIQATYVNPAPNVGPTVNPAPDPTIAEFSNMFNTFADNLGQQGQAQAENANFFKKFSDYISSKAFNDNVNQKAEKYKVPPKQLAKGFILKVLGIIGDILGIVVNTVTNIADLAVSLLSQLLHGTVEVVNKVANGIVSVITCNQTATVA